MTASLSLQFAGLLAVTVALYHGVIGDKMMRNIAFASAEEGALMRGSFHIGTVGWLAGGVLLFVASFADASVMRSAIVLVFALVYGIPGVANMVISRFRPNFGWIALIVVVILSLTALWL